MSWRECKSLLKLREQVNAIWPNRDRRSDGEVGDLAHSKRKSDHNPNAAGVVTALDIDRELGGQPDGSNAGDTVAVLVAKLQASRDPRIKYLIWNAQITLPGDISKWKPYHGANAHKHHCHISVSSDPKLYDDAGEWDLSGTATVPVNHPGTTTIAHPQIQFGVRGPQVGILQNALTARGFNVKVDNDFGRATEKAVKEFQHSKGLAVDGIAGPDVWKALGF